MLPTHQRPQPAISQQTTTQNQDQNQTTHPQAPQSPQTAQNSPQEGADAPSGDAVAHNDDGAFLADFVVPDIDDDADDLDAPVHVEAIATADAAEVELIGKDAFFTVFLTAFAVPQFVQSDLAVLAVQPDEESAARAASDATYGLLKIYYPAALTPKGEVFGHLMIAGPFFIAKAMIVREVLRARRAKPANPQPTPPAHDREDPRPPEPPAAANDNWPMDIEPVDMEQTP